MHSLYYLLGHKKNIWEKSEAKARNVMKTEFILQKPEKKAIEM